MATPGWYPISSAATWLATCKRNDHLVTNMVRITHTVGHIKGLIIFDGYANVHGHITESLKPGHPIPITITTTILLITSYNDTGV